MIDFFQCSIDISRHRYVNKYFAVVPLEGKAAVEGAVPVNGDCISLFEVTYEVSGIGFGEILETKIINT